MVKKSQVRWTPEEETILREHGSRLTNAELQELVPRHTQVAIRTKCNRLGILITPELKRRIAVDARAQVDPDDLCKTDQSMEWEDLDFVVQQVLLGSLLGDGSVKKAPNALRYIFYEAHARAQEDYVDWKAQILRKFLPKVAPRSDGRRGGKEVWTVSHNIFTMLRDQFYPERTHSSKTRYPEIAAEELDTLGLLIWFLDDGHAPIRYHTSYPSIMAKRFRTRDLEALVNRINERLGLEMWVRRNPHKGGWAKKVLFGATGRDQLFPKWVRLAEHLDIPKCMHYKLQGSPAAGTEA